MKSFFNKKLFKGPPITSTIELDGKTLLPKDNQSHINRKDIATGPFTMKTPAMSTYSQQLWVIAKLATENTDGITCLNKTQQFSCYFMGVFR